MFRRNIVSLCFILSKQFQLNCGESVRLRLAAALGPILRSVPLMVSISSPSNLHFTSHLPPSTAWNTMRKNFWSQFKTFFDNFSWNWIQHKRLSWSSFNILLNTGSINITFLSCIRRSFNLSCKSGAETFRKTILSVPQGLQFFPPPFKTLKQIAKIGAISQSQK